jgi:membrane-bound serine protease (ClpP class)
MPQSIAFIVLLLLAGLVLVFFELLTPSFGLLAGLALAAFVGAVWLTFTLSALAGVVMIVTLLFGIPAYIVGLVRLLPQTAWGRKLFLSRVPDLTAAGTPAAGEHVGMVGRTAVTETMLRPAGAIRLDGRRVIAMSESGIIEKGARVKVIAADGTNVIVRRVGPPPGGGPPAGQTG